MTKHDSLLTASHGSSLLPACGAPCFKETCTVPLTLDIRPMRAHRLAPKRPSFLASAACRGASRTPAPARGSGLRNLSCLHCQHCSAGVRRKGQSICARMHGQTLAVHLPTSAGLSVAVGGSCQVIHGVGNAASMTTKCPRATAPRVRRILGYVKPPREIGRMHVRRGSPGVMDPMHVLADASFAPTSSALHGGTVRLVEKKPGDMEVDATIRCYHLDGRVGAGRGG